MDMSSPQVLAAQYVRCFGGPFFLHSIVVLLHLGQKQLFHLLDSNRVIATTAR
jgi:hypothetical protein